MFSERFTAGLMEYRYVGATECGEHTHLPLGGLPVGYVCAWADRLLNYIKPGLTEERSALPRQMEGEIKKTKVIG